MRILIVKLGSIGDIVHTLPALAAIRACVPSPHVTWAVERGAAEVLRDNPLIDSLVEIDTRGLRRAWSWTRAASWLTVIKGLREQLASLRICNYDVALDFQGLLKSAVVARISGAPRRIGFNREALREPASRFLLTESIAISGRHHVIAKNLRLVAGALNLEVPANGDDYEFPMALRPEHQHEADALIANFMRETRGVSSYLQAQAANGFAILNPAGGWWTKLWEAERFGELADRLWEQEALPSIVSFGPGEAELAARVVKASRCGRVRAASLPLRSFVALARRASVYVGGDTGPTHLAIAAGAPVVGLFGPTEWWRNGSPRGADTVVERAELACRDACHRRTCDRWMCMDMDVARVAQAVGDRLRRAQAIEVELASMPTEVEVFLRA